jgi:hypothetical protein
MNEEQKCAWCENTQRNHHLLTHLFTLIPEEFRTKGSAVGWSKIRYGNIATAWKHTASNYRMLYRHLIIAFRKKCDEVNGLKAQKVTDLAEVAKLRAALEKYAQHKFGCPVTMTGAHDCYCGLEEVLGHL